MRRPHINANLATILVASVFVLLMCSKEDTSPVEPDLNPTILTVSPSSGAPGTLLNISGYLVAAEDTATDIYIGGELSIFIRDSSGIQTMIPLFLDSASHWPAPPSGAVDVEIRKNGEVVAQVSAAVTVDSLQHADGSTERLRQNFIKLTSSLRVIYSSLPTLPSEDPRLPGYRSAILAMLDSLTSATDSSLAAVMQGTSTWNNGPAPDMSLMDGLMASSGALDFFNEAANSLGRLTDSLTLARQQGDFCRGGGEDMDLACQMQIFVVLNDYANYFVKPTTTTYANTVGMAAGLFALSGVGVPAEAIIGALLTVFDLVYGTIAPSLFPAEITEFSLTVATDTVAVDELTNTAVLVAAVNHPASIRATQVLDLLLKMLGITKTRSTDLINSATAFLKNAMSWALGMYRDAVIQSNTQSGGAIFIDPTADIPKMTWGPVMVTHSDLVQLYSFTEDFITADTGSFEWKGVSRGKGRIQARGRGAGERSKVLIDNVLCVGCIYSGGAFGNNAPGTETKTVWVGDKGKIHVIIEGLPDSSDAAVTLTDPNGATIPIIQNRLFNDMKAGDYSVIASDVLASDGEEYKPTPQQFDFPLESGDSLVVRIVYSRKNGRLLLNVTGLPQGVDGDVIILDSSGGIQGNYTSSAYVKNLAPGKYSIVARRVTADSSEYEPSPKSQIKYIVADADSSATIIYSKVLEYIDVRGTSEGWVAQVGSQSISDELRNPGPRIINQCDNTRKHLTSFLPFHGKVRATSLGGTAWARVDILGDSTVTGKVNIIQSASADGGVASVNGGYNIDIYNSLLDTLEVTLEWNLEGFSSKTVPGGPGGVAMGYTGFKLLGDNCREVINTFPVVDSSGLGTWSFGGSYVDTLTEAYSMFVTRNDLWLSANSGTATAQTRVSIAVRKLNH